MGFSLSILGRRKKQTKNKSGNDPEKAFKAEILTGHLEPFLYGKYEQDMSDELCGPRDMFYMPFIIAMTREEKNMIKSHIMRCMETEFGAKVYEHSAMGFAKANIKGHVGPSCIYFIKIYEDMPHASPLEYIGVVSGRGYSGNWSFLNQNYEGGKFELMWERPGMEPI